MKSILYLYFFGLVMASCTVGQTILPTQISPSDTPTPISTKTPTTVWFPPTSTYTPFPTPVMTPTPDIRPNIGRILLEDDFSDQSAWTTSQSHEGNVAFGMNELTIAIGETAAYLYSVRENPIFSDFYLEITAQPNLCSNFDEYGMLFRVSSSFEYYRFSLSCNGQGKLDRVRGENALSLQPWTISGSVPPGAPSKSRIGIAAIGGEMHFFVNDQYQFSVNDPFLTSGSLGVYALSSQDEAVTVNFSDLIVYQVIP